MIYPVDSAIRRLNNQGQISNYQQILCHAFSSWITKEFIFPVWSAVMECLTWNIKKSARRNLFKKQINETIINIIKQKNL